MKLFLVERVTRLVIDCAARIMDSKRGGHRGACVVRWSGVTQTFRIQLDYRVSNAVLGESGLPWDSKPDPIHEMPIPSVGLALQARFTPRER